MEITLDAIISLVGLFVGGSGGAFFMWRWQRKKAKAEAMTAEVDAAKELRELYAKMLEDANTYLEDARTKMDGLRQERDHYRKDRDEIRENLDKLTRMYYELKTEGEKERAKLRVSIATLQSQLRSVASMTCSVQDCRMRQIVSFAEQKPNDIEPYDDRPDA